MVMFMGKVVEAHEAKLGSVVIKEGSDGVWRGANVSVHYDTHTYNQELISAKRGSIIVEFKKLSPEKWSQTGHLIENAGRRGERAAEESLVKDLSAFLETPQGKSWVGKMERRAGFKSYSSE
jgi:hypothetical protein